MDGIIYYDTDPKSKYKYHIVLGSDCFWYDITKNQLRYAAGREYSITEYRLRAAIPNEFFF